MTEETIVVSGMTCGHCVAAVSEELEAVPGVRGVTVDLPTGRVDIVTDGTTPPGALVAAIGEAGYAVVGARPVAIS